MCYKACHISATSNINNVDFLNKSMKEINLHLQETTTEILACRHKDQKSDFGCLSMNRHGGLSEICVKKGMKGC